MSDADVVIVGGGIAGSSLAKSLASAGKSVVVLEASEQFEDRVRGEQMHAWGVKEARDVGVEQVLLDAGAHVTQLWKQYMEGAEPADLPVSMMVPGVEGTLNLRHPDACQALIDAAAAAGASVHRGVENVKLGGEGSGAVVSFQQRGEAHEVHARVVVGADGRASTVRKQSGIELERSEPTSYIAGLLLDDLDMPQDFDAIVSEGDTFFVLFHQGNGRARAYVALGKSGQHRFSGAGSVEKFLDAARLRTFPWSDQIVAGTPAGPCATYPGDDTWTDAPFTDGVVLIGDAAGYNDPIIGQGLSISMRDVRIVRDLLLDGAEKADDFREYGAERVERMRRLRFLADVAAVTFCEDADNRPARRAWVGERLATMDPEVFPLIVSMFAGPETAPDELIDDALLERIRTA
jgi:2-polyprenyl-6-methoxyphenol hydroxylase-like FAD-dependent oxidoreductase